MRGYGVWIGAGRGPAPLGWAATAADVTGRSFVPLQTLLPGWGRAGFPSHSGAYVTCPMNAVQTPGYGSQAEFFDLSYTFIFVLILYLSQAWNVRGAGYIHMGDAKKELFSYSSIFSLKGARTQGTVV